MFCADGCGARVFKAGEVCMNCQAKALRGGLRKAPPKVPIMAPVGPAAAGQHMLKPAVGSHRWWLHRRWRPERCQRERFSN
jgi:hypothetical protein